MILNFLLFFRMINTITFYNFKFKIKTVGGGYDFEVKFKTVVTNYGFKPKFKFVLDDYDFKLYIYIENYVVLFEISLKLQLITTILNLSLKL